MALLKHIEEIALEVQQQLVGGSSACSCSCQCSCHCENSGYTSSRKTTSYSSRQTGRFRGLRG